MMTLDEARDFFGQDIFATKTLGAVIDEVSDDSVTCSFEIKDIHKNAIGLVMGGAIYTLCDFAFAVATNSKGTRTVTTTSNITFLNPTKGNRLSVTVKAIKDGKTLCIYEAEVYDDLGVKIAFGEIGRAHV